MIRLGSRVRLIRKVEFKGRKGRTGIVDLIDDTRERCLIRVLWDVSTFYKHADTCYVDIADLRVIS